MTPVYNGLRMTLTVLYILWGIGGFLFSFFGTTTLIGLLFWLSVALFLALGALMVAPKYMRPDDVITVGELNGFPYRAYFDGRIELQSADGPLVYKDWDAARRAVSKPN